MTQITVQDGKVVMRDGKVGTEQECCCGRCDCIECGDGFSVVATVSGSKVGPYAFNAPYGFTEFGNAGGNIGDQFGFTDVSCSRDAESSFLRVQCSLSEVIAFGSSSIIDFIASIYCGPDWSLDPGEWFIQITGNLQTAGLGVDDSLVFDYEKLYLPNECQGGPLPFLDTNNMTVNTCELGGVAQDPCPMRITAAFTVL